MLTQLGESMWSLEEKKILHFDVLQKEKKKGMQVLLDTCMNKISFVIRK